MPQPAPGRDLVHAHPKPCLAAIIGQDTDAVDYSYAARERISCSNGLTSKHPPLFGCHLRNSIAVKLLETAERASETKRVQV